MTGLAVAEIDAGELSRHPNAIDDIYHRRLDVLVVKGAFDVDQGARAIAEIERDFARFPWTPQQFPDLAREQMLVMGMTLTPVSGFDLDHDRYFETATRFRAELGRLFDDDFEKAVVALLGHLSSGRPVRIPEDERGRAYTPATIRKLPPGFGIPVHCGNFFLGTPGYRQLARQIDLVDQLSYFATLGAAESGGELEIYALEWGDPATPMLDDTLYDGERIQSDYEGLRIKPGAGDLLLFDGGRYYHRVTAVGGASARWTIGGFVGLSSDHREILIWS